MANDLVVVPGATEWFVSQFQWPNSVMFHYTSKEAFEAILSTRRMWAMDLRTMNDPGELLYGKALIDKRVVKAAQRFRGTPIEPWVQTIRKLFQDLVVKRSSTFSISLSEHPDMPNQWRNYAAGGAGFVLGWSIDSSYPGTPLKTWVTYDRPKQTALIDGLIAFHASVMMRGLLDKAAEREQAWMSSSYSLFRFLNAVWLTFKDPSWSTESEFRYVYHVFDEHLPDWCTIKTRPETGRRYIEADFGPADLKYVGIGPMNDPVTSRRWVDDILRRNGFNGVHVAQSTVSIEG
jgi:hypothetical protein